MRLWSSVPLFITRKLARNAISQGDRYRDLRDWAEAASAYQRAVEIAPGLVGIWVQLGHMRKECGDLAGAESAYREAVRRGLEDADIHLHLGHVLKHQGDALAAARSYVRSLEREPGSPDALRELIHLDITRADLMTVLAGSSLVRTNPAPKRAGADGGRTTVTVAFDVTDVVSHMSTSRRPSGIQRVQLNTIGALIDRSPDDVNLIVVCFSARATGWIEIPADRFIEIARLMTTDGGHDDMAWRRLNEDVTFAMLLDDPLDLPRGTRLVNLGSSWAFPGYHLAVREARARRDIIYVPFVHDCIPIVAPEFCVPGVRTDFREWVDTIVTHADALLANSKSTARDISAACRERGVHDLPVRVIPLDAIALPTAREVPSPATTALIEQLALHAPGFVLFVSTIEPRKNHSLAFDTWLALLQSRGSDRVPRLLCVGSRGWENHAILKRLADSERLSSHVTLLHDLADADLFELYRRCRFTIYPSRYEGWGLPVSESLAHGRPTLVARTSSLPEAGGEFADYFDIDDPADFRRRLERLMDDDAYLMSRQVAIEHGFVVRQWRDVARQVMAETCAVVRRSQAGLVAPEMAFSTPVVFARGDPESIASGAVRGEPFRAGRGWGRHDARAAWLANGVEAEVSFVCAGLSSSDEGGCEAFVLVCADDGVGYPQSAAGPEPAAPPPSVKLEIRDGRRQLATVCLTPGERRWIALPLPAVRWDSAHVCLSLRGFSLPGARSYVRVGLVAACVRRGTVNVAPDWGLHFARARAVSEAEVPRAGQADERQATCEPHGSQRAACPAASREIQQRAGAPS